MPSITVSERWVSRSARLEVADFFDAIGSKPFALLYGDGPDGRWILHGEDPLDVLHEADPSGYAFERSGEAPPLLPDFVGFLGYEYGYRFDPLLPAPLAPPFPFPDCCFSLYRTLRLYDRREGRLYEAERNAPRRIDAQPHGLATGAFSARRISAGDGPETYAAKVSRIREEIARGNVYQVNLTRQERWSCQGSLVSFARRLYEANPAPFSALMVGSDHRVISSSPERFIRIDQGRITARPIKGTAPRGTTPEDDAEQARTLVESLKNRSELAMITDLLRNDLTRVCRVPSVRVEAFPTLETYANVHHLVSTVSGELRPDLDLTALLQGVFPGGSITGCPKLAAMTLIRELEDQPRMVYTGALGWFSHDLRQMDLNIPIRTAWASKEELRFGVGGGVVWDSDPHDEYLETVHKGRSLVQCLS